MLIWIMIIGIIVLFPISVKCMFMVIDSIINIVFTEHDKIEKDIQLSAVMIEAKAEIFKLYAKGNSATRKKLEEKHGKNFFQI